MHKRRNVLLKQINASTRPFGADKQERTGGWYFMVQDQIFSSFAKSILKRFLPNLLWNCTSTNSVPCSISLLRIVPSPKVSWRTLSPGLNCCSFGFAAGGGVAGVFAADVPVGVTLLPFPAEGALGGVEDEGRELHCDDCGVLPLVCGLPEPKTRPVSRSA